MFVVKTISQLEEAIRERAPDVMVVGALVDTLMKRPIQSDAVGESRVFAEEAGLVERLSKNFNVSAIHYRNDQVKASFPSQSLADRERPW